MVAIGSGLQLRQEEEFWEEVCSKIEMHPDPLWKSNGEIKKLSQLEDKHLQNAYSWMEEKFFTKFGITYDSCVHQKFMLDRIENEAKKRGIQLKE